MLFFFFHTNDVRLLLAHLDQTSDLALEDLFGRDFSSSIVLGSELANPSAKPR